MRSAVLRPSLRAAGDRSDGFWKAVSLPRVCDHQLRFTVPSPTHPTGEGEAASRAVTPAASLFGWQPQREWVVQPGGGVPEAALCSRSVRGNHCLSGSPESRTYSGILTSFPNCFLQVQLDNLPGMSLVAGKALSSARMSDAVLSQSSLMGSQQFQDGENEGKGPYAWGAPPPFSLVTFLLFCIKGS